MCYQYYMGKKYYSCECGHMHAQHSNTKCVVPNCKCNRAQVVVLLDYIRAAEQSVQLTAFGVGMRASLGKLLVHLGCWIAKVGVN